MDLSLRMLLAGLLCCGMATAAIGQEPLPPSFAAAIGVRQIVGHRGSSADCPENTLASTRRAIAARATAIEVDVRLTKDQQLVLRHDADVDHTTNGKGKIRDKTLAELKQLDAGSWFAEKFKAERIPTLEEVLAVCRGKIDVLLDLKEEGEAYAQLVAGAIKTHGEESRTIVGVRSVEQAVQFRTLLPKARQLGLIAKPDEIEAYAAAGVEMIRLWPKWLTDDKLVARVRAAKAQLHLNGTTGTEEEIVPLLAHRPDSLSADDPARLLATLKSLASRNQPAVLAQRDGELKLPGLKDRVEISRDAWGVAHIYAQNADDLFFAQGFVAAQDRLFQIDIWRRQGMGELAEIMGPSALEADAFARLLRYRGDMDAEWKSYSPDTQAIATAFTRGVNAYIDHCGEKLPLEFQVLGYRPKKWAPADILGRSSGIYMSQNFRNEVLRLKLIQLVGEEKARWLAPVEPALDYRLQLSPADAAAFPEKLLQGYEALTKTLSFTPPKTESNNWVVSGARSQSGKPLLASDPHRAIALPSLRYIVHLHAPGWNVIGAGEPGLPGVALGHNERIAWGITIVGADTADIVVEELNPANANQYASPRGFQDFVTYDETIHVKGQAEPTKITLKYSRHGPILYVDEKQQRAYALQWSGNEPGGAAYLPALAVARAQNQAEFQQAIARWHVPGLNFVYADVDGNIGWVAAAHYPLRGKDGHAHSGLLPVPGKAEFDWTGFLPPAQHPQQFNPSSGTIVTANHNILPANYAHVVGYEFTPPYRFQRLDDLLRAKDKWELREFCALQQDSVSLPAQGLVKLLAGVPFDAAQQEAAQLLTKWDGHLSVDSSAGPLYALWQKELLQEVFERQVPQEQVKVLSPLTGISTVLAALEKKDPRWLGEQASEQRQAIVRKSFERAFAKWQQLPTAQRDRWGALHQVTFRHPMASLGVMSAELLNVGPFERPGEGNTPNNTRYDENFQQIHGASYRQLFDLADWDRGLATNAPGQSGQPGSPHYHNLAEPWSRGEYFPLYYSRGKVEQVTRERLWLQPSAKK